MDTKKADIRWLDNPEVFRVNQLPAHSDHEFYKNQEEQVKGKSSYVQSLNGKWKFCYSENASDRPAGFFMEDFDSSDFDEIAVPQHIELAGYDKIHYINYMYPWEGHLYRRPAFTGSAGDVQEDNGMFSKAKYNPAGSYLREFDLDPDMLGKRISVYFAGVEQAMYVWLNGEFVGYAEDSFTPSEFDLTPWVKERGNILAVEVHKRSSAAFLEDQDFFRFFGIFRDVALIVRPEIHLEDLWIRPEYDPEKGSGKVEVDLTFTTGTEKNGETGMEEATHFGIVKVMLKEGEQIIMERCVPAEPAVHMTFDLQKPVHAWSNADPYLYQFYTEVYKNDGTVSEVVPYCFGFRKIEIREMHNQKQILFNGKRLIIHGVNRHEWSAESGRCITESEEKWDMDCMKRNHINAVRTCHYPNRTSWYDLCDENGIYVIAETNLESHGSWMKYGAIDHSWNVPGDVKEWEAAVVDRARTNFEVLKNHTSILFWSLGNESYAGECIRKMNEFYKQHDPGRLVHYEGVVLRPDLKDCISDVESQMYTPPEKVEEYLKNNPKKPFLLCEYMHDIGSSMGGLGSYMELLDQYECFHGGFIWTFIDQALYWTDEVTGRKVLRYGGDFDDRPSDYEFTGNGIVFANRVEKPAVQEVRYYYGRYKE